MEPDSSMIKIEPFRPHISGDVLADLTARLRATRWPSEIDDVGWEMGSDLAYVKELCGYWADQFDWPAQEASINRFPHFKAQIDGQSIHFIHVRGTGRNPIPLVITHGWPSTFAEMLKLIPLLTDPEKHGAEPDDSFDVVVPSLPGYGFSGQPRARGMNPVAVAAIWHRLMTEGLGYRRFSAQGGDWGAFVTTALGHAYPADVNGIHITMFGAESHPIEREELSAAERDYLAQRQWWSATEGAYGHQHRTKPQSLAYGLTDSPAGLAGWIVEKWRSWSDCGGELESRFSKDELLTHLTIYWATATIASSIRLYFERNNAPLTLSGQARVQVPTAFARFPVEIGHPPREWLERFFNLVRYTEMETGGHFAAAEEPGLLAADIRAAFRFLR